MSARLPGTSRAAPTPWNARAAISDAMEGANPHQADAAAKRMTPMTKTLAAAVKIAEGTAKQQQ